MVLIRKDELLFEDKISTTKSIASDVMKITSALIVKGQVINILRVLLLSPKTAKTANPSKRVVSLF